MNLSPLFVLQARLHEAAAAGCALIGEDFRLARALEDMRDLEAASAVFAKLTGLVRSLLEPTCPDPVRFLLDALTLADALVCTQAASSATGPVGDLPTGAPGPIPGNVLHSTLAPLLDALRGRGNPQRALDLLKQNPELASNFRVQPLLVRALGSSLHPLAEEAERLLARAGSAIVPLLRKNFEAAGPKERLRRLLLIDAKAGAEANDFYLAHLDKAPAGPLRLAFIHALRHDPDNVPRLLELAARGRGRVQLIALHALAAQERPEAADFLRAQAGKNPLPVILGLQFVRSGQASALLADLFSAFLEDLSRTPSADGDAAGAQFRFPKDGAGRRNLVQALFDALPGKKTGILRPLFRRLADLGTEFDAAFVLEPGWQSDHAVPLPFSRAVPVWLREALVVDADEGLLDLALALAREGRKEFAAPAVTGLLALKSAGDAARIAEELLAPEGFAALALSARDRNFVLEGLDPVVGPCDPVTPVGLSDNTRPRRCFVRHWKDTLTAFSESSRAVRTFVRPFADRALDPRWICALLRQGPLPPDPNGFNRIPGDGRDVPEKLSLTLLRLLMGDARFTSLLGCPQEFLNRLADDRTGSRRP